MSRLRSFIWWSASGSAGVTLLLWWALIFARIRLAGSLWEFALALLLPLAVVVTGALSLCALIMPAGPGARLRLAGILIGALAAATVTAAAVWNVRSPQPTVSVDQGDLQARSTSPDGRFIVRVGTVDVGAMATLTFAVTVSTSATGSPQYEVDLVSADDLRPRNDPTSPDFGITWERGPKGPVFFVGPRRYEIDEWPPARSWWDLSQ